MNRRINQYQKAQKELPLLDANPHQVIQILMREFLTQVYQAKASIERKDIEVKNKSINKAIKVIGGLQGGLNMKEGTGIADNFNDLYNYITIRLTEANAENSVVILDEIKELFSPIKDAWDNISESDKALGFKLLSENDL
ncbi:flagellar export chaperone FliS [Pseudoalteromonas distincta]|jgi:flagellar protein FliS|uniref:flagellar export chaperone FliS n=1 Tax=Pseudoalteromonas distincta TaxID=77608 RepID=UPI00118F4570|nr:flagellar export chaperone FliS [Pseudoalteromonas elyakovii]TVU76173.1 flagellar export chaperone FliS [Pseudoalteromonas elyakovii]|tara:strand:+ start:2789 stop:3208 length:420 start_codon:yes stop_codon:yes gene_type:complete